MTTILNIEGYEVVIYLVDASIYPGMNWAAKVTVAGNDLGVAFGNTGQEEITEEEMTEAAIDAITCDIQDLVAVSK